VLNRKIVKRAKAIGRPARTPAAVSRGFDRLSDVVLALDKGFAKLKPPYWAEKAAYGYLDDLRDLGSALDSGSSELAEPVTTLSEAKQVDGKINRALKAERKGYKRLIRDIGAIPTLGGGGGEEEAPGTDGEQQS